MGPRIPGGWTFPLTVILLCGSGAAANAETDIALITMGRVTYPKKSWTMDYNAALTAPDVHDPAEDVVSHSLDVEAGLTDRLSLGVGFETAEGKRNSFPIERAALEGRYKLFDDPVQLAPFVEFLPSLTGEAPVGEIGFEALRNYGWFTFRLPIETELSKEGGEGWKLEAHADPGAFYRFGLNGIVGAGWEYESTGGHTVHALLGGRVSRFLFLAVEPCAGLNRKAPDFGLLFQLDLYSGPYKTPGLD